MAWHESAGNQCARDWAYGQDMEWGRKWSLLGSVEMLCLYIEHATLPASFLLAWCRARGAQGGPGAAIEVDSAGHRCPSLSGIIGLFVQADLLG